MVCAARLGKVRQETKYVLLTGALQTRAVVRAHARCSRRLRGYVRWCWWIMQKRQSL
jgi:hypothetical protein